jgi:hypothetical protein
MRGYKEQFATRLAALGILLLVGIIILITTIQRTDHQASVSPEAPESFNSEQVDPAPIASVLTLNEVSQERQLEREPFRAAVSGVVKSQDGSPLSGADLSWTTIAQEDSAAFFSWGISRIDGLDSRTSWTISAADGVFHFANEPPGVDTQSSVIWVTALGYQPYYHGFRLNERYSLPYPIILHRSPVTTVRVLDATGTPVTGARIHHLGWHPPVNSPGSEREDLAAYSAFHRVLGSDDAGEALLSLLEGTQVLWAELNGEESEPWTGLPASEIVLRLKPCFLLSGTVVAEDAPDLRLTDLHILCGATLGGLHSVLKQVPVSSSGAFGPIPIPVFGADRYDFTLGGATVLNEQLTISSPPPGALVTVDFTAKNGIGLRVRVVDEGSNPIAGASVWAWSLGKEESSAVLGRTDQYGNAVLAGFPMRTVSVQVEAAGYAASPNRLLDLASPDDRSTILTLKRAGSLTGRCTHNGEPVEDFSIVFWQGDSGIDRIHKTFRQAKGGFFSIDEVPLGEILLYGFSDRFPRSDIRAALIADDAIAEIEITLPEAIVGHGQIIDSQTGDPIPQAEIQIYSNYRANYHESWGPRKHTDSQGRFQITGFAPGDTRFAVYAPDYATLLGHAVGVPGEEIDLGLIAIARNQTLEVRLVNMGSDPINFSEYKAIPLGNQFYPMKAISQSGSATFEGGPGNYYIRLLCPDGSEKSVETFLSSGADWIVEFPVGGGKRIDVHTEAPLGRTPADVGAVNAQITFNSSQGRPVQYYKALSLDGQAFFDGISGNQAVVEIFDSRWVLLGAQLVTLELPRQSVVVPLEGLGLRIKVVDDRARPLEGTTVRLVMPSVIGVGWLLQVVTDSSGEVNFRSLGLKSVLINLSHPMHGSQLGIPVDVAKLSPNDVVVISLHAQCKLRLRLMDGPSPLPAVPARLYAENCNFELGTFTSDSVGRIESGPVAAGGYRIVIQHPGLWHVEHTLQVLESSVEQAIQVRRLGGLAVETRSVNGLPIAGVQIELLHQELGESISEWAAQGRILLSSGGLVTDSSGYAVLQGIPNGVYSWRAPIGQKLLSGEIAVPAKSIASFIIVEDP